MESGERLVSVFLQSLLVTLVNSGTRTRCCENVGVLCFFCWTESLCAGGQNGQELFETCSGIYHVFQRLLFDHYIILVPTSRNSISAQGMHMHRVNRVNKSKFNEVGNSFGSWYNDQTEEPHRSSVVQVQSTVTIKWPLTSAVTQPRILSALRSVGIKSVDRELWVWQCGLSLSLCGNVSFLYTPRGSLRADRQTDKPQSTQLK